MGNLSNLNIALELQEVLIHHDVPHLFLAVDKVGTNYVCLLVSDNETEFEYVGMPVSEKRLQKLLSGEIDLRTLMQNSELGFWYLINRFEDEKAYAARMELESIPEEWLPQKGFYLNSSVA
jgi:hypothetical protein